LAGEAGEIANAEKKAVRDNLKSGVVGLDVLDECGDVLFYMRIELNRYGYTIEDAFDACAKKLERQRREL
jgi:phosphoribosyl-ATP pyrophosphohydrolase